MQNLLAKPTSSVLHLASVAGQAAAQASQVGASQQPNQSLLRLSAQALLAERSDSDAAIKFLTWGLVAIAHIVLLFAMAQQAIHPQAKLTDPITLTVALIQPNVSQPKVVPQAKTPAPVSPADHPSKAEPIKAKQPLTPVAELPKPLAQPMPAASSNSNAISLPANEASKNEASKPEKAEPANKEAAPVIASNDKAPSEPVTIAPKFNANYLHNPAPEYPKSALRRGEQGKVMLRVLVSAEGLAESVSIEQSSGFESLDKSALQAVKNWKFIPATLNNHPVSGSVIVPIRFNLDS